MQAEKLTAQQRAYIIGAAGAAGATIAALKIMGETAQYSAMQIAEPAQEPWQHGVEDVKVGLKSLKRDQAFMLQEQGVQDVKKVLGSSSFEKAIDRTMENAGQTAGDVLNALMMENPGAFRSLVRSVKEYMGAHEVTKTYTGEVSAEKNLIEQVVGEPSGSRFYQGVSSNVLKTVARFVQEAEEAKKSMSIDEFLDQYGKEAPSQAPSAPARRNVM